MLGESGLGLLRVGADSGPVLSRVLVGALPAGRRRLPPSELVGAVARGAVEGKNFAFDLCTNCSTGLEFKFRIGTFCLIYYLLFMRFSLLLFIIILIILIIVINWFFTCCFHLPKKRGA